MWSLAFALGASRDEAHAFQRHNGRARSDPDPRWAVLLGFYWQQLAGGVADDAVTAPWANELHHRIADVLEQRKAPGRTVTLGQGKVACCPDTVRLPCRDCGHMFVSRFRGDRFRRTCGVCFPYSPAPPQHPRGGLTLFKQGSYRNRRRGSTLGVDQYGQDVLCSHPDCLELFVSTRGDEEYCAGHQERREQARRLRRSRTPKHVRWGFRLAPGVNGVQYHLGPDSREVRIDPGQTRFAADEQELVQLVALAASGSAVATDVAPAP